MAAVDDEVRALADLEQRRRPQWLAKHLLAPARRVALPGSAARSCLTVIRSQELLIVLSLVPRRSLSGSRLTLDSRLIGVPWESARSRCRRRRRRPGSAASTSSASSGVAGIGKVACRHPRDSSAPWSGRSCWGRESCRRATGSLSRFSGHSICSIPSWKAAIRACDRRIALSRRTCRPSCSAGRERSTRD